MKNCRMEEDTVINPKAAMVGEGQQAGTVQYSSVNYLYHILRHRLG